MNQAGAVQSNTREIDVKVVKEAIERLLPEANYNIPPDVLEGLRQAAEREQSEIGRRTLQQIIQNYELAAKEQLPVCQDSGVTVILLEIGQDVHWVGGDLREAIFSGVRRGTKQGYLRWSTIGDPLARQNSGDDPAA